MQVELNTKTDEHIIVIDIETSYDTLPELYEHYAINQKLDKRLKDPVKIEANKKSVKEKFALNPKTGRITSIGYLTNISIKDYIDTTLYLKDYDDLFIYNEVTEDESEILKRFWEILHIAYMKQCIIVTKNGKKFDIPFIFNRGLIKNVLPNKPIYNFSELVNQYNKFPHYDLEQFFVDGSLMSWAYLTGLSKNLVSEGAECIRWFKEKEYRLIEIKNEEDLIQTYSIYKKIRNMI